MKKLLFLFLLFAGINVTAQQTKIISDANAKQRTINGTFTAVNVATGVQLYLTQGNETALVVSVSDEKYEERLKTEVVDGVLKIYMDYKGISWLKDKNRKIKEEQLAATVKLAKKHAESKATFIRNLFHEIRTPMHVLSSFFSDKDPSREDFEDMKHHTG